MVRSYSPLTHFSIIDHPRVPVRFLILDCPTETSLPYYLSEFKQYNVLTIVRCCQPTYSTQLLSDHGIDVVDLPFPDGGVPGSSVLMKFLEILNKADQSLDHREEEMQKPTVAVHCVAGLGRAPVLVAVGLIELGCIAPLDAIDFIRQKRRGAFNRPQILYLDQYKRVLKRHTRRHSPPSASSVFSWGGRMMMNQSGGGRGWAEGR
ncbi:phosphatases II [Hesseltinella vesiculosa]|uniref:protein-tyrosine-phosphatase n=1 Tax=Hesseltinella vesiculosa TaxID=101127 RepID=A0A1X2G2R8_9FUNG|nr:phosphatases II [Hesseltinella vesiculosa]